MGSGVDRPRSSGRQAAGTAHIALIASDIDGTLVEFAGMIPSPRPARRGRGRNCRGVSARSCKLELGLRSGPPLFADSDAGFLPTAGFDF
jgi:hypothetical protein